MSRALPRLLALALVVGALLLSTLQATAPAQPAGAGRTQDRLDSVEDQIQGARQELHDIDRRSGATQADLERLNARQAELADQLRQLEGELFEAQTELDRRRAELEATQGEIADTEQQLAATRRTLRRDERTFAARTRATYIAGSPSLADFVLDLNDLADVAETAQYLDVVLERDQTRVERVDGLKRRIGADLGQLDLLRREQARLRAAAESDRDRVAGIVDERRSVQAEVAAEAAEREVVLGRLAADREAYEQQVSELQEESDRLEARLRALALAERRRAEEEARRAAEQARREAEEARRAAEAEQEAAEQEAPAPPAPDPEPAPAPAAPSGFVYPVSGPLSSPFGYRIHPITGVSTLHAGIDISAPGGTSIVAAASGTVYSAGWLGGYGNAVVITHSDGLSTLYAHQSSVAVSSGQSVSQGQTVGYVGSTGFSTGNHLHFEVRLNGTPVDPLGYL